MIVRVNIKTQFLLEYFTLSSCFIVTGRLLMDRKDLSGVERLMAETSDPGFGSPNSNFICKIKKQQQGISLRMDK
jgi:hypothetical protein